MQHIGSGRTADIYRWDEQHILKLLKPDFPDRMIEYEFEITQAVYQTGFRCPRPMKLIQHEGRSGILYEYIAGLTLTDAIRQRPYQLRAWVRRMADLHVAMHRVQGKNLPSMRESLAERIQRVPSLNVSLKQRVLDRLASLPDGSMLCHSDFHPFNIMVTSQELIAIDWIDAKSGHPAADAARTYLLLLPDRPAEGHWLQKRLESLAIKVIRATYLQHYYQRSGLLPAEILRWVPVMAAARLMEGIHYQEKMLLGLIEEMMR